MIDNSNYKIATVNHHEHSSGAAFIARTLFQGFRERGIISKFIVQHKTSHDPDVWELSDDKTQGAYRVRLRNILQNLVLLFEEILSGSKNLIQHQKT